MNTSEETINSGMKRKLQHKIKFVAENIKRIYIHIYFLLEEAFAILVNIMYPI